MDCCHSFLVCFKRLSRGQNLIIQFPNWWIISPTGSSSMETSSIYLYAFGSPCNKTNKETVGQNFYWSNTRNTTSLAHTVLTYKIPLDSVENFQQFPQQISWGWIICIPKFNLWDAWKRLLNPRSHYTFYAIPYFLSCIEMKLQKGLVSTYDLTDQVHK